jgi:hypothetical protein
MIGLWLCCWIVMKNKFVYNLIWSKYRENSTKISVNFIYIYYHGLWINLKDSHEVLYSGNYSCYTINLDQRIKLKINKTFTKGLRKKIRNQKNKYQIRKKNDKLECKD